METQSGVIGILRSKPYYNMYVPNDGQSKTSTRFSFQARDTIPWSLQCEKNSTRAEVIDSFATAGVTHN